MVAGEHPRQDKDHGVIPENHLQKVDAKAMAYSFAVPRVCEMGEVWVEDSEEPWNLLRGFHFVSLYGCSRYKC